jgi:hypothetical protein
VQSITIIYTKRRFNPISWLIRWALPRSRFSLALASHCMIVDGDHCIEASMLHGVRRVPMDIALAGQVTVIAVDYSVPDADAGLDWLRSQVGQPYDWRGAFGLALDVDRDWQEETDWFCFELAACTLERAGRAIFADTGHITGSVLMAIKL